MHQYLILPLLFLWVTPVFSGEYVELSLDSFIHMQKRLAKIPGWPITVQKNLESVEGYKSEDIVNWSIPAYQHSTNAIDKWEKNQNFYRIRYTYELLYWRTYLATAEIRGYVFVVEYLKRE